MASRTGPVGVPISSARHPAAEARPVGSDGASPARRWAPTRADSIGTAVAGLWPVLVTLVTLRNPSKYNPVTLYSGLGRTSAAALLTRPTTTQSIFSTSYSLGLRAATALVHGHVPWFNPFESLGTPLIGEMQSGGLFPFTPLLLIHDGSLVFHLALEVVAGISTYWLMRTLRCTPVVAAAAGMLFATNGTFAWLGGAAFNPVCFIPLMLLGVERSRRAANDGTGAGWRWLAVGGALALLAGFIETTALAMVFTALFAVQRGWSVTRDHLVAYARKVVAGLAAAIAIAAPLLIAFHDYLDVGDVGGHAGVASSGHLGPTYLAMWIAPYLFGRIGQNPFPAIHTLWGAVGGYAGFALVALGVASLFGRRERGLRIALFSWVAVSMAETLGVPGIHQLVDALPVVNHIVVLTYVPATWELALVILAGFALRDLATRSRAESVVAIATGVLATMVLLVVAVSLSSGSVAGAETLSPNSLHLSELAVLLVAVGLIVAALAPSAVRVVCVGVVAVVEAAVLFCVPLLAWPSHITYDAGAVAFLEAHGSSGRFASLGVPAPNLGSAIGVGQIDIDDDPVPTALVAFLASLDPLERPTAFTGEHPEQAGRRSSLDELRDHLSLYERLGVRYVVAPASTAVFPSHSTVASLAYAGPVVKIWRLSSAAGVASAAGCGLRATEDGAYASNCAHPSLLVIKQLDYPGWSATVNGAAVAVTRHGRFEAVALPAGHAVVAMAYLPPDEPIGIAASLLALVSLVVPWGALSMWRRRRGDRAAALSGLVSLGQGLHVGRRPAPDEVPDLPTGAVEVVHDDLDAPTSVVAAVSGSAHETMAVAVIDGGDAAEETQEPPTSAVAAQPRNDADPPTMSVPVTPSRRPRFRR